ncbi:hypothetical protein ApAK_08655 [Thermoplasmatales archaeon AK]|nr:hypothetical protein [Thermoplasmatales archaeon AK]
MGKISDAAIAVIVLIIGIWALTRLGLSLPAIERMFHTFFFPSGSSPTNATSGFILGLAATASKARRKRMRIMEFIRRSIFLRRNKALQESLKGGDENR